jgi:hypothetical protein
MHLDNQEIIHKRGIPHRILPWSSNMIQAGPRPGAELRPSRAIEGGDVGLAVGRGFSHLH